MSIFGWTFIRTDELEEYRKAYLVKSLLLNVHRWFAGWQDLDIIWKYVFSDLDYFGDISTCREEYAKARGTNIYGQPKDQP